ncbi:MAG: MBL fold metallo-hydrolase [Clostridia bacterium]|nr:MBL fold metallo-hydrolase [Clostridia bacterium]
MTQDIHVKSMLLAPIGTRCYLVYSGRDAIVIDPASSPGLIIENAALANVVVKAILLTHGHFDHIGAAKDIADKYGVPVYIGRADVAMLTNPLLNASLACGMMPVSVSVPTVGVDDGDKLTICGTNVVVISTPGHTAGSVCYLIGDCLFTGDTYFAHDCYGRTDLPTGDADELDRSLEKLSQYVSKYKVYPGH